MAPKKKGNGAQKQQVQQVNRAQSSSGNGQPPHQQETRSPSRNSSEANKIDRPSPTRILTPNGSSRSSGSLNSHGPSSQQDGRPSTQNGSNTRPLSTHVPGSNVSLRPHRRPLGALSVHMGGPDDFQDNSPNAPFWPPQGPPSHRPSGPRPQYPWPNQYGAGSPYGRGYPSYPYMYQPTFFPYPDAAYMERQMFYPRPPPPFRGNTRMSDPNGTPQSNQTKLQLTGSSQKSNGAKGLSQMSDFAGIYKKIQDLLPKLDETLVNMAAAILIEAVGSESIFRSKLVNISDIQKTSKMLNEEPQKAKSTILNGFKSAEKDFLSGKPLQAHGGHPIAGTMSFVPETSSERAEWAIQQLLADSNLILPNVEDTKSTKKAAEARKTASRIAFPKVASELLEHTSLHELHLKAMEDLDSLLETPACFEKVPDIAFGLMKLAPETEPSTYAGKLGVPLPELTQIFKGEPATLTGDTKDKKSAVCFRNLRLTAKGASSTLVDVRAYPDYPSRFSLIDNEDFTSTAFDRPTDQKGAIRLEDGEDFDLTLVLDTRGGYQRSAERGLLQQLVLFTVITDQIPETQAPNWQLLNNKRTAAIVFACRVSVALTSQTESFETLLRFEAKPFVPKHLSTLFDQKPSQHYSFPPPIGPLFKERKMMEDVWAFSKFAQYPPTGPAPPAHVNQGMTWALHRPEPSLPFVGASSRPRLPNGSLPNGTAKSQKETELESQIRKYKRLLTLEETAMEDQIRRYDMFNVRCKFAVFETSPVRPSYRIHTIFPNKDTDLELASSKKPYRGPDMWKIFPDENMADNCLRRVLTVIEVPGLPEDRPSLKFGDLVHVRFSEAEHVEFTGYVIVTESSNCHVAMPKIFYTCCATLPRSAVDNRLIAKTLGLQDVRDLEFSRMHVRFGFDRGPMARMHKALDAALSNPDFHYLPPVSDKINKGSIEVAGLPSEEDFFEAVGNSLPLAMMDPSTQEGPSPTEIRQRTRALVEYGKQKLNGEQKWAIASFLAGASTNCPFTIYGPPGTGKTVTLVECALQILRGEPAAKLLLCAPQGYSADLLASALAQAGVTPEEMMRLADPRHPPPQMKNDVFHEYSNFDNKMRAFGLPTAYEVARKRVIVMTCGAAGMLRSGDYQRYYERELEHGKIRDATSTTSLEFTHVLIDEAGQALIPEVLGPLSLMQYEGGKALLCGDPKQLGPVVRSLHAATGLDGEGLSKSLLEAFLAYNASQKTPGRAPATATLVRNYRSLESLLELPNRLFYDQQLIAAADQEETRPPSWSVSEPKDVPKPVRRAGEEFFELSKDLGIEMESLEAEPLPPSTIFVGVQGTQMREGEAPSFFNPHEATMLVDLVERLLKEQQASDSSNKIGVNDIGVIATYRKQVQKIRLLLRQKNLSEIRVGTVDDLQGQEERVIFISTVLSNPESLPKQEVSVGSEKGRDNPQVGLWRNPRRFNVATTRAKALLVVLGHPIALLEDPCWRELMRYCKDKNAYLGSGSHQISHLISSKTFQEHRDAFEKKEKGDRVTEDVAALVNRTAATTLLNNETDNKAFSNESMAAYQSEVSWRMVL